MRRDLFLLRSQVDRRALLATLSAAGLTSLLAGGAQHAALPHPALHLARGIRWDMVLMSRS